MIQKVMADQDSNRKPMPPRVIIHIPHSSRVMPPDVRSAILLSDQTLDQELLRLTDAFTDELFEVEPSLATPIIFPVSRLVVDVERFCDDRLEPMAARGMGAVYLKTSDGENLRADDTAARECLLAKYYRPHHRRLTAAVQNALNRWDSAFILDAHSFASVPLPHEFDQGSDRPHVCIGTDGFHSPERLVRQAVRLFEAAGFRTILNRPFKGALVPQDFHGRDTRVSSIMIEVNRGLYMNEASGEKLAGFDMFCRRFQRVLSALIREVR
jgi:N-formylglutamate deformylase